MGEPRLNEPKKIIPKQKIESTLLIPKVVTKKAQTKLEPLAEEDSDREPPLTDSKKKEASILFGAEPTQLIRKAAP